MSLSRCPFCAHEFEASEGPTTCPSCGKAPTENTARRKPAHLTVLEAKPKAHSSGQGDDDPDQGHSHDDGYGNGHSNGNGNGHSNGNGNGHSNGNGNGNAYGGSGRSPGPQRGPRPVGVREPAATPPARGRFVSTAGPALPVRRPENDSVPSSWLSRLEAARLLTSAQHAGLKPEPPAPIVPPPLKRSPSVPPSSAPTSSNSSSNGSAPGAASGSGSGSGSGSASSLGSASGASSAESLASFGSGLQAGADAGGNPSGPLGGAPDARSSDAETGLKTKPAHVLVAELEAGEKARQAREQARLEQLIEPQMADEISQVEIKLEAPKKRKRWVPDWLVVAILAVGVAGGVYGVYAAVKEEPAPVVRVDPKLIEAKERRAKAIKALQHGHELALLGAEKADAAIVAYKQALELEPTLASAERGLAIAYTAKDDKAQAVLHYERYLTLDPKASDAAEVRAIIEDYRKVQGTDAAHKADAPSSDVRPDSTKSEGSAGTKAASHKKRRRHR